MRTSVFFFIFSMICLNLAAQNIFRTACQGNLARLDSLLDDTSINTKDNRERSLIHWAIACNKKDVFDYLVQKGININVEDDQKMTPMHMAIRFSREDYFDALYQLQEDNTWIEAYGASLLTQTVLKGDTNFIRKLIENGVNVNSTNSRGSTALEIAQRTDAKEMANLLLSLGADQKRVRNMEAYGAYMGQSKPKKKPKIFAPNFISTEEYEFGSVFNTKGTAFYYGVDVGNNSEIRFSERRKDKWTHPEVLLSHPVYGYNDPFLSLDENRLYFISRRADNGIDPPKDNHDIWYLERIDGGWSTPINAGPNINSDGNEYYISFTQDGTMYFSSNVNAPAEREDDLDIYYSKFVNGEFQKAVALESAINTEAYEADVFVDPQEEYIIFCSTRAGGLGRGDLYISFKQADGAWTKAINMGGPINTRHHELCPYVSADGKYFFYTSDEDIYWVSTKIFKKLKKKSR